MKRTRIPGDAKPVKRRHRPGRTGLYTPAMVGRVYKMSLLGLIDTEIANVLGINPKTLALWKKSHPEFKDAIKKGKSDADSKVAAALFEKACGYSHPDTIVQIFKGKPIVVPVTKYYPPDTGACIFWLKNRTKGNDYTWMDSTRAEITGANGRPIDIRRISEFDLSKLDTEQLEFLKDLSANLIIKGKGGPE